MPSNQGTSTINFGAWPGSNEASVDVTGQAEFRTTSGAEAWFMGDDTSADHTAADHKYAPCFIHLTCGSLVDGTGFTIFARSTEKMTGQWSVRWVWAD